MIITGLILYLLGHLIKNREDPEVGRAMQKVGTVFGSIGCCLLGLFIFIIIIMALCI